MTSDLSKMVLGQETTDHFRGYRRSLKQKLGGDYFAQVTGKSVRLRCVRVDLWEWEDLVRSRDAGRAPEISGALARYREALGTWNDPWVTDLRARLDQERHAAALWLADLAEAAGDLVGQVRYLEAGADLEPACGRAARFRLLDLYDELGAYEKGHEIGLALQAEGGDAIPSAVIKLLRNIASKWERRRRGLTGVGLPWRRPDLIGREVDLIALVEKLRRNALVTLTGPARVGKTALAALVAIDTWPNYAGGARIVDLSPMEPGMSIDSDVERLARELASRFSVRVPPDEDPLPHLIAALHGMDVLLVLDGCEPLVGACRRLVDALLRCEGLKILATSQIALSLSDARHDLDPLPLPPDYAWEDLAYFRRWPVVRLFLREAHDLVLTAVNARGVDAVCRSCNGIPGEIQIAAGALRGVGSPEELSILIDALCDISGRPPSLVRPVHVWKTMDWRYERLSDAERSVLQRLSVFRGGWDMEAGASVCSDRTVDRQTVIRCLVELWSKSLIVGEADRNRRMRYGLLSSVQSYAAHRLGETSPEFLETRNRHRASLHDLVGTAAPHLSGPDQTLWLLRLDVEYENVLAALDWYEERDDDLDGWLTCAGGLTLYWASRGLYREGQRRLLAAADAARKQGGHPALPMTLYQAGALAVRQHRMEEALALATEAYISSEASDHLAVRLRAASLLGFVYEGRGEFRQAFSYFNRALPIAFALNERNGAASILANKAYSLGKLGKTKRALELFDQSLENWRAGGDRHGEALTLTRRAIFLASAHHPQAKRDVTDSLAIYRELGATRQYAYPLRVLIRLEAEKGHLRSAAILLGAMQTLRGDPFTTSELEERLSEPLRKRLGEDVFGRMADFGRTLARDPERLVRFAQGQRT
ncbi:MAG TPA: hypothetical protein VGM37_03485 [Armatimonadota bacterium]